MHKDPSPPKIIKIDPADVVERPEFKTYLDDDEGFDPKKGWTLFAVLDKPEYHAAMPGDFLHLEGLKYEMVGRQYRGEAVIFQTNFVGRIPPNEF